MARFNQLFRQERGRNPSSIGKPPVTQEHVQIQRFHRNIQSVGATGGVYKGQGRNQRGLMSRDY